MDRLDLVPFHPSGPPGLVEDLERELAAVLGGPVRRRAPWFDPEAAYDPRRGQYSSTELLRLLLEDPEGRACPVLGVTGVDLFAPVLTYVFGEAQLGGRAAVVSSHRLQPERYGLEADESLVLRRLVKESVHELGHVHGLVHCGDARCVMQASTYVEDIDYKPSRFCPACLVAVQERLARPDPALRT